MRPLFKRGLMFFSLMIFVLIFGFALAPTQIVHAQLYSACSPVPIANNDLSNWRPQISGDYVVWYGYSNSLGNEEDSEVFLYHIPTGEMLPLTNNDLDDQSPSISGNFVAYAANIPEPDTIINNPSGILTLYDITNKTYRELTTGEGFWRRIAIDGNFVAWSATDGDDTEIFVHDIAQNLTTQVTDNVDLLDDPPALDDGYVAWTVRPPSTDNDSINASEIMLYEIATDTTTPLTDNAVRDAGPMISDGRIMWFRSDQNDPFFYTEAIVYDIASKTTTPLDNNFDSWGSYDVLGNNAVGVENVFSSTEIVLYDLTTLEPTYITDDAASDTNSRLTANNITWEKYDSNAGGSIFWLHDFASGVNLPLDTIGLFDPGHTIEGDYIVWDGSETSFNDREIYLLDIGTCVPTQPTNLKLDPQSQTDIALTWDQAAFAESYRLEMLDDANWAEVTRTTDTAFTHSNLDCGTTYAYRVFAVNSNGDSLPSDIVAESTEGNCPTATPTNTPTATATPTATPTLTPTLEPTPKPLQELIVGGGFENGLGNWVGKRLDRKDKIKCNKVKADGTIKIFAHDGECAFRFKGSPGERNKLKQKVDLETIDLQPGNLLTYSAYVNANKLETGGRLKMVVQYTDAQLEKSRAAAQFGQTDGYELITTDSSIPILGEVSKIKVLIKHRSQRGKVLIDSVSLTLSESQPLRFKDGGRIPLPTAQSR